MELKQPKKNGTNKTVIQDLYSEVQTMSLQQSNKIYMQLRRIRSNKISLKNSNHQIFDYNWVVDEILAKAPSYDKKNGTMQLSKDKADSKVDQGMCAQSDPDKKQIGPWIKLGYLFFGETAPVLITPANSQFKANQFK